MFENIYGSTGEAITAGRSKQELGYNELSKKVDGLITQVLLRQSKYGDKK